MGSNIFALITPAFERYLTQAKEFSGARYVSRLNPFENPPDFNDTPRVFMSKGSARLPILKRGRVLCARRLLTLHPAHGQSRHHESAEPEVDDDRRQRIHDGDRHHIVPWRFVAVEELVECHRHGHVARRREQ